MLESIFCFAASLLAILIFVCIGANSFFSISRIKKENPGWFKEQKK